MIAAARSISLGFSAACVRSTAVRGSVPRGFSSGCLGQGRRAPHGDRIASAPFGFVKGGIGGFDELLLVDGLYHRQGCDPDTDRYDAPWRRLMGYPQGLDCPPRPFRD